MTDVLTLECRLERRELLGAEQAPHLLEQIGSSSGLEVVHERLGDGLRLFLHRARQHQVVQGPVDVRAGRQADLVAKGIATTATASPASSRCERDRWRRGERPDFGAVERAIPSGVASHEEVLHSVGQLARLDPSVVIPIEGHHSSDDVVAAQRRGHGRGAVHQHCGLLPNDRPLREGDRGEQRQDDDVAAWHGVLSFELPDSLFERIRELRIGQKLLVGQRLQERR